MAKGLYVFRQNTYSQLDISMLPIVRGTMQQFVVFFSVMHNACYTRIKKTYKQSFANYYIWCHLCTVIFIKPCHNDESCHYFLYSICNICVCHMLISDAVKYLFLLMF